ncbi:MULTISPECIES: 23S rRNA (guanine(1835)-N(2))-methyltransferase RlmG [Mangrovibacter]|uniref:Ribosomal RNA large subunit methyltransferase G n=1 Tax=Mangrovibacter plantisponsor TaxID=451513 RepID=A0A317PUN5_9ENTR|nr:MULTISPECIES: 23S rRNA (guanine(1835)-N(2))-methyltransferase RlmG [Mangrovibacter]KEA53703.1 23S rRNA methyltransferase [Mangrovibacter sp. MFB070]PWW05966.1 16S rRNA G1207 methylase RsmC [Mangrovibacter plantisponsor]
MSQVELAGRVFALERFPVTDDINPLQAWDAADEYLLQQVGGDIDGPLVILNDNFGALTCALAEHNPVFASDSLLAQIATERNLQNNGLDDNAVTFQDSLAGLPEKPALVLIKVPKQLALLAHQLEQIRQVASPQTRIIAAGKAKEIHNSTLALFERILGPTTTSLAWKKARLIHCTFTAPAYQPASQTEQWPVPETGWTIHNHANVFSRSSLDIGARFFMQHLPENLEGSLVDLGCGNGVIGLSLLSQNPQAQVTFIDESSMAVASSRLNVEENLPGDVERSVYLVNNSLAGLEANQFDAVLCNPPFHQQNAVTDNIAWQMFNDARRCLKYGGELRIVGNRHLDYYAKLKRVFGNCTTLATNKKFVVLRAVKTRKQY